MNKRDRVKASSYYLLYILFIVSIFGILFIVLHEGGHVLAAMIGGGNVTVFDINPFTAHVQLTGNFTSAEDALINISGAALPLLVWIIFILLVPRQCKLWLELIKFLVSIPSIFPLFVWIIVPILHIYNRAPMNEDATKFVISSGIPPLVISLCAFGLLIIFTLLALYKLNLKQIMVRAQPEKLFS